MLERWQGDRVNLNINPFWLEEYSVKYENIELVLIENIISVIPQIPL